MQSDVSSSASDIIQPSALTALLHPQSIAIIGASPKAETIGGRPLANLRRFGYTGKIHLVSRSHKIIDGIACLPSALDIPQQTDVALLLVPATAVSEVLEQCGSRGVRAAIVYGSGYAETGKQGQQAQEELVAIAHHHGITLVGPNCLGLVNFVDGVPLTFSWHEPRPLRGRRAMAIVAQSGAVAMALSHTAYAQGIAVSYTISTGNEAQLSLNDYIDYLLDDSQTHVIALLAEQIREGSRFLQLAIRAQTLRKPLVLLKAGRSKRAQEAARSHTGALTGDYATMQGVLRRYNVIIVETLDELVDTAGLLTRMPLPTATGTAIMSDSGALVTLAIDHCEAVGLPLPSATPVTETRLRELLPIFATQTTNPIDMTTQGINTPELYPQVAQAQLDDPQFGSLILLAMPGSEQQVVTRAQYLLPVLQAATKPVAYTLLGGDLALPGVRFLQDAGIPVFRSPERAFAAMAYATAYAQALHQHHIPHRHVLDQSDNEAVQISSLLMLNKTGPLSEYTSKEILHAWGIPIPVCQLARTVTEALEAAEQIGYPVALKVQVAELLHKTEMGGVILDVKDPRALSRTYTDLYEHVTGSMPNKHLDGILVETMAKPGIEIALGIRRDPTWGSIMLVGLGGIWIEALHDIAIGSVPLNVQEAQELIKQLRSYPLLAGTRGRPQSDLTALAQVMVRLGTLAQAHSDTITEIDLNPLILYPASKGLLVVDTTIICN